MASWSEAFAAVLLAAAAAGCRAGLPPEPPRHDAADPSAPAVKWSPGRNPLTTSSFAGDTAPASGHAHHHHGKGDAAPSQSPPQEAR